MTKSFLASLCLLGAAASLQAQLPWFDSMSYPAGNITTNTDKFWVRHSGSANDSLVVNYAGSPAAKAGARYEVNQGRSDDIHRLFFADTNGFSDGAMYASFIVSVTNLPSNVGGTYFAHFMDINTNQIGTFRTRAFTVVPANPFPYTNAAANTFRFGVANAAGDASGTTGGPTAVAPVDLALNTDYQVVLKCDIDNVTATVWVNPAAESDTAVSSGAAFDFGPFTNAMAAFAFRQAAGEGVLEIRDVMVGRSFAEVVTNVPVTPVIGLQPANVTNYAGNPAILEVAASGMGLSYQWYRNGGQLTGETRQLLLFSSLQGLDQGTYYCAISNSADTTNSESVYVSVNSTPTRPVFTLNPANMTNSVGDTVNLSVSVSGTGPLTYQWKKDGVDVVDGPSPLPGDVTVISGAQTPFLKLANTSTNMAGNYTVLVTGGAGSTLSAPGKLTIAGPRPVTIAYLRSLFDTTTWQPADKTTVFSVTGVITSFTNTVSGNNSSYYLQDDTAGINLFVTGGVVAQSFRPQLGDQVTANGTLLSFQNNLELQCSVVNPYQTYSVISHSNALPAPKVVALEITNSLAATEAFDGSLVMLTNIYFTATTTASANKNIIATNAAGQQFLIFFPASQDQDLRNRTLPGFAWTVTGILARFNNVWECMVTRFVDVVGTAPAPVSVSIAHSAGNATLSWPAVPFTYAGGGYAYTVLGASNISGPWTPVAAGLSFPSQSGAFSESIAAPPAKFYKVTSP